MSVISSKTIRPVVAGVGYHITRVPQAAEFAQIDYQLATYGLDSVGADTVTGNLSLQQDPDHVGFGPSITGSFFVGDTGGAFAVAGTGPAGSLVCSGTSVPAYSSGRLRRVLISMLEATRSATHLSGAIVAHGNAIVIDSNTGGITTASSVDTNEIGGAAEITIPLTKPHDGANFFAATLYWYVPSLPHFQPSLNGAFRLESISLALNAVSVIGTATITAPATPAAWWNNGQVQSLTISGLSTAVDLTDYTYRFVIVEPACGPSQVPYPVWTGIAVEYSSITGEGFTQ